MQGGSLLSATVLIIVVANEAIMHTAEVHDMQEFTVLSDKDELNNNRGETAFSVISLTGRGPR